MSICQFFSFLLFDYLFFLFLISILYTNRSFSKLCLLKFSFLLFEIIYEIGKLRKQIKFFTKFANNDKFNSDFPLGMMLGKFLMEKPSPPLINLVIFSKKMISAVKTLKKLKSIESPKMVSKRLYGHYLRS